RVADLHAHRRWTAAEDRGHLLGRKLLDVAEDDREALLLRQRVNGPHQARYVVLFHEIFLGNLHARRVLNRHEEAPAGAARVEVAAAVHGNPVQPAEEVAVLVISAEVPPHAHKRLLKRLFHLFRVAEDVPGEGCDAAFGGDHDLFERMTVTRPGGPDAG